MRKDFTRPPDLRDAATNLVVVGEEGGDSFETANFLHPCFCRDDRRAERKFDAFGPRGHQDAGEKITGSTDGFAAPA